MLLHTHRDAAALHTYLTRRLKTKSAVHLHEETVEIIPNPIEKEVSKKELIEVLTDFILETYQEKWLDQILTEEFFYAEEADREQILEIVRAIFAGEKPELPNVNQLPSRRKIVREAISDLIEEQAAFSFQSLETFRLSSYYNCLIHYLEIAIDEYKLQQEYAAFIDKLRRIVKSYRPLRNIVYAVDRKPIRLYDEHFRPIENTNSIRSFYPLLKQWGVEAEPSILLTLIGLAPLKVYVFTDRPDDGMMRTLQNVFEERVEFQTIEQAKLINL
ncbi:MAG: putative sporulation protein YtxC [Tuberibacillus sp.]